MNINEATKLRITQLCTVRKLSRNKLATLCGIPQTTLSNIVNRENNNTTIQTIKKICDGLEITLKEFFDSEIFDDLEQEIK